MGLPDDYDARKKNFPLYDYMFGYFPDSFLAEVEVAVAGNKQHANTDKPGIYWDRSKSKDQLNTAWRHQFDYGMGKKRDTDGCWHLAKAIWRLRAQLQLDIEAEREANRTPAEIKPHTGIGPACGAYGWVDYYGYVFTPRDVDFNDLVLCKCNARRVSQSFGWQDQDGATHYVGGCNSAIGAG